MQQNQDFHITVKQPPNPNPVRTIAILENPSLPTVRAIIDAFLSEVGDAPKSPEFIENVKEEAFKAIALGKIIAVSRNFETGITSIHIANQ